MNAQTTRFILQLFFFQFIMKAYFYFTQHARVLITIRGSILVMAMESSQKILLLGLVIISLESSTA